MLRFWIQWTSERKIPFGSFVFNLKGSWCITWRTAWWSEQKLVASTSWTPQLISTMIQPGQQLMVKGCWLDFGGLLVYSSRQNICKTLWITILFISDIPTRAPEYQYSHEGPQPRRHSDHQTSQDQGGLIRVPKFHGLSTYTAHLTPQESP